MQSLKIFKTSELLEQWGMWAGKDLPPSYRCTLGDMRGGSVGITCLLTDIEAGFIDGAVAKLKQRDPLAAQAIKFYFINRLTTRSVAQRLKVSVSTTDAMIKRGEYWVDAYIYSEIHRCA